MQSHPVRPIATEVAKATLKRLVPLQAIRIEDVGNNRTTTLNTTHGTNNNNSNNGNDVNNTKQQTTWCGGCCRALVVSKETQDTLLSVLVGLAFMVVAILLLWYSWSLSDTSLARAALSIFSSMCFSIPSATLSLVFVRLILGRKLSTRVLGGFRELQARLATTVTTENGKNHAELHEPKQQRHIHTAYYDQYQVQQHLVPLSSARRSEPEPTQEAKEPQAEPFQSHAELFDIELGLGDFAHAVGAPMQQQLRVMTNVRPVVGGPSSPSLFPSPSSYVVRNNAETPRIAPIV